MPDATSNAPLISHKWREISDLPENLDHLRDRELEFLFENWDKERGLIGDENRISEFNAQLSREWAIETGIIENVYTLDRGTTRVLIERGIDASQIARGDTNREPELVARIIRSHMDALEGLFAFVKEERDLSSSYIKELHSVLLSEVETVTVFNQFGHPFETKLEKGAYKRLPNSPTRPDGSIHEFCPPEHVASEMDRLIEMHHSHVGRGVRPHIEAAWLHHAFTQIHPFQDGNGRVARTIASLIFIKAGLFPLVVTRDDRAMYIDTLEAADSGQISPLVELFAKLQKRALTGAISRAAEIKPVQTVKEAVAATRDLLVNLGKMFPTEYLAAKETANALSESVEARLNVAAQELSKEITRANSKFRFQTATLGGVPNAELSEMGEKLKYEPNPNDYHRTALLNLLSVNTLSGAEASSIAVSVHGVGAAFRGVLVAVAYFKRGSGTAIPLVGDVFRINYNEPRQAAQTRFATWLEHAIVAGLAAWRRTVA